MCSHLVYVVPMSFHVPFLDNRIVLPYIIYGQCLSEVLLFWSMFFQIKCISGQTRITSITQRFFFWNKVPWDPQNRYSRILPLTQQRTPYSSFSDKLPTKSVSLLK